MNHFAAARQGHFFGRAAQHVDRPAWPRAPRTALVSMSARPLPFRLRVPLAKILHAKRGAPAQAPSVSGFGEEMWDYTSKPDYLRLTLTSRVYDVANESPMLPASKLSERLGNAVYFKREDLQPGYSFKVRGAYNKLAHMKPEDVRGGVLAHAVGAHAEGVAIAAHKLGVPVTVVLPEKTSAWKQRNLERLGATLVLHGRTHEDAVAECARLSLESGRPVIPSFDDPLVIAGQGTVGLEVLRQLSESPPHAVFVCVGGGGLLAGVSACIKAVNPAVKVIGVEATGADAMGRSLRQGYRLTLEHVEQFAEGAAVARVGEETFRICDELVDDMITVTPDEICASVQDGFEDTRAMLEPAGAIAIAGLKKWAKHAGVSGETLVAVTSGANLTFNRLRMIAERALIGQRTEALLAVRMPDRPGAMLKLYGAIAPRNVTEMLYRSSMSESNSEATIFLSIEVNEQGAAAAGEVDRMDEEVAEIVKGLAVEGIRADDMSENELAKSHMRYLAGGTKPKGGEMLYRFEFPEQPGALNKFLTMFNDHAGGTSWNLTLLHYRYRGAEVSRVLTGIQVPPAEMAQFQEFLDKLGYYYVDESSNVVYSTYCD